jgi:hypothetical protein
MSTSSLVVVSRGGALFKKDIRGRYKTKVCKQCWRDDHKLSSCVRRCKENLCGSLECNNCTCLSHMNLRQKKLRLLRKAMRERAFEDSLPYPNYVMDDSFYADTSEELYMSILISGGYPRSIGNGPCTIWIFPLCDKTFTSFVCEWVYVYLDGEVCICSCNVSRYRTFMYFRSLNDIETMEAYLRTPYTECIHI